MYLFKIAGFSLNDSELEMATSSTPTKKKKVIEEFDDVASICSAGEKECASIHGVLAKLSPMKKGKKTAYFDGSLSDGNKDIRIFGFSENQHKKLLKFQETKDAVNIIDCEVKKSSRQQSDKLEVMVKSFTEITNSSKKFDFEKGDTTFALKMLPYIEDYETVSVSNVIQVDEVEVPIQIPTGASKQDAHISDGTGTTKLTLWEDDIGKLKEGGSYKLSDVSVRSYDGEKYLSFVCGSSLISMDDAEAEVKEDTMEDCEVIGVYAFNAYPTCLSCKQKVTASDKLGTCVKCGMKQKLDRCKFHVTAKLMISKDLQLGKF